jgi:hypothetical protein
VFCPGGADQFQREIFKRARPIVDRDAISLVFGDLAFRASPPVCRNHNHNHKQRGTYEHIIGSKNHTFHTNHKLYGYGELSKSSPTGKP